MEELTNQVKKIEKIVDNIHVSLSLKLRVLVRYKKDGKNRAFFFGRSNSKGLFFFGNTTLQSPRWLYSDEIRQQLFFLKKKSDELRSIKNDLLLLIDEIKNYREDKDFLSALIDLFIEDDKKKNKSPKELLIDKCNLITRDIDSHVSICQYLIDEGDKFLGNPVKTRKKFENSVKFISVFTLIFFMVFGLKTIMIDPVLQNRKEAEMAAANTQQELRDFDAALAKAMQASKDAQKALTVEDWTNIESLWGESIFFLAGISADNLKYLEAQKKMDEYRQKLAYVRLVKDNLIKKKEQDERSKQDTDKQAIDSIFNKIEKEYGFRPMIDTWGGYKALFIPSPAWFGLTDAEETIVMDYARYKFKVAQIIIGDVKSSDTITVDTSVACFDERVAESCSY